MRPRSAAIVRPSVRHTESNRQTASPYRRSFSVVRGTGYTIAHRPIASLPLIPHPQQNWVACVDEIDNAHVGLIGMLAMQASSVLLQGTFPRNRHCKHQGVERRMVETFADQFTCGQQNARGIGGQGLQVGYQRRSLIPGQPTMQHKRCRHHAPSSARKMAAICSVRSVSTRTLRPRSTAAPISAATASVRAWSLARCRNTS